MGNKNDRGFGVAWPNGEPTKKTSLADYFHWYEAGIGFAVASLFWGICFHLWGG